MKIFAAIIVALALIPAVSSASQDTDAIKTRETAATSVQTTGGHVYVVNGDVFVAQGKNPAHRVNDNEIIISNTLVNTGENSSALLKFDDGQIVTMQANSAFLVREYRYDAKKVENSNIVFSMFKGGMRFITGLIGKARKQAFRLSTPNATIGIRGTEFMVAMADKSMYSQVLAGKIAMTNAAGMKLVGAGKSAVVASPTTLASLVPPLAIPADTFSKLLSIPVDPSAIPAPAPAPAVESAPPPVSAAGGSAAGAAAAATTGVAEGAMAGMTGSDSTSTAAAPEVAAAVPEVAPEPVKEPEPEVMAEENGRSGVGITGKVGTLGYGAELNFGFSDNFGARLGYNTFSYKYSGSVSSVDYDVKLKLRTISILGDWYPFAGGFRTSGGLVYNDNHANLTGKPTGSSYTIGNNTYLASDIGSMQGTMSFTNVAPYLGIGWGNPVAKDKGWGMTSDIGVLFQGSPKIDLTATCSSTAIICTQSQLDADANTEKAKMQDDLKHFKFWPVISIGISYQW